MAVHHGGKVGAAGKTLATKSSSKSAKSKAGKTLANHKHEKHKVVICYRNLYDVKRRYRTKNSAMPPFCSLFVSR